MTWQLLLVLIMLTSAAALVVWAALALLSARRLSTRMGTCSDGDGAGDGSDAFELLGYGPVAWVACEGTAATRGERLLTLRFDDRDMRDRLRRGCMLVLGRTLVGVADVRSDEFGDTQLLVRDADPSCVQAFATSTTSSDSLDAGFASAGGTCAALLLVARSPGAE